MIVLILTAMAGILVGCLVSSFATWLRVHRQEARIRGLITGIQVLQDMGDEVPSEWVVAELESMVAQEFR